MRIPILILVASSLLASGAPATRFSPGLSATVRGAATPVEGALAPASSSLGLVFIGQELRLTVLLSARAEEGPGTASSAPIAIAPTWWSGLRLRFDPVSSSAFPETESVEMRGADLEVLRSGTKPLDPTDHDPSFLRVAGDNAWVDLIVPAPPPGDYALTLRLPSPRDDNATVDTVVGTISSRRGDENPAVRRSWLRVKSKSEVSFSAFAKLQMELIELEPDNWTLWEDLANRSLGVAPAEETIRFYDRAYELLTRSPEPAASPMRELRRADETFLTLFKRLYPIYATQRDSVMLEPVRRNGVKTFKAVDRKSGAALGTIDPLQPALPARADR